MLCCEICLYSLDLAVLDPDPVPYWECGFRSGSRRIESVQKQQMNLVSCFSKGFCTFVDMFLDQWTRYRTLLFLSCKNYLFCDFKVWPGSGSASGSVCCLDPDLHWDKNNWLRIRIEPMRIHNTGRMTVHVWLYVRYFNWKDTSFVFNNITAQECSEGTPPAVSILVSLPIHVVEQVLEFQVIRPNQNRVVYNIIEVSLIRIRNHWGHFIQILNREIKKSWLFSL